MKKWVQKLVPPKGYCRKMAGYSPFLIALLWERGIKSPKEAEAFFNPNYDSGAHDPCLLRGVKTAVKRIKEALKNKEKIAIYGDYDADGVTASSVLFQLFKALGTTAVVYIPDRVKEGYGLNYAAADYLLGKKVSLVITVDTGIRNREEIVYFQKQGLEVIVTDHHLPPKKLPKAVALINPHLKNSGYPFSELSGAGVAFKLATALIRSIGEKEFPAGFEKWLLDLVAIGTIADLVPLVGENRVLAKYGLLVLGKTRRLGILAILKKSGLLGRVKEFSAEQVAFLIAPRINAAGRMDHANSAFVLLNETDQKEAVILAEKLEKQNSNRQKITAKILKKLEKEDLSREKIIIKGDKDWPFGLVGLVAGRLCDKYCRPVLAFTEEADKIRGSARSISKFNIIKALDKVSDLLLEYGGHKQAAGFTLKKKDASKFKRRLLEIAEQELKEKDFVSQLRIDYEVSFGEINLSLVKEIKKMEPFGAGNPEPIFLLKGAKICSVRMVGNGSKHLKACVCQDKKEAGALKYLDCIGFNFTDPVEEIKRGAVVDLVFNLGINSFNGRESLELKLIDLVVVS
jgi:single-stranded-DNA-specific exonuclease